MKRNVRRGGGDDELLERSELLDGEGTVVQSLRVEFEKDSMK